jgi:hypothetical protein
MPDRNLQSGDADLWAEALRREGRARLAIRGDSMAPLLSDGQEVEVEAAVAPAPGEVAVVRQRMGLLAHRVIGVRWRRGEPLLLLRGEAVRNLTVAAGGEILGRVVAVDAGNWRHGHRWLAAFGSVAVAGVAVLYPLRYSRLASLLRRTAEAVGRRLG